MDVDPHFFYVVLGFLSGELIYKAVRVGRVFRMLILLWRDNCRWNPFNGNFRLSFLFHEDCFDVGAKVEERQVFQDGRILVFTLLLAFHIFIPDANIYSNSL